MMKDEGRKKELALSIHALIGNYDLDLSLADMPYLEI